MKKKLILISICLLIISFLFVRGIYYRIQHEKQNNGMDATVTREDGITKAMAAKMLTLLSYTEAEAEALERIITYQDTDKKLWYDKYINGIITLGYHDKNGFNQTNFNPMSDLTYEECYQLLVSLGYEAITNSLSFQIADKVPSDFITYSEWMEIYAALVKELPVEDIQKREIYIVGKPDDEGADYQIVTNEGIYGCNGISFEDELDKSFMVYLKVDKTNRTTEIIGIEESLASNVVIENVWFIEGKGQKIKVFINGCTKTFKTKSPLAETVEHVIGDITIEDGLVVKVSKKPDVINGKVLIANEDYIEIEGYGKIEIDDNYRLYRTYNELAMEVTNAVLVGYKNTDFVVANGKICAALIKESIHAENIRVLIKTTAFKDIIHSTVKVTADCDYTVYYGKEEKKYKKGKIITLTEDSKLLQEDRIRIQASNENGKIQILSINRNGKQPSYRGTMEIARYNQGLTVINELPLEEYLYAVIPSEMPTSYHIEALKVQAICARSYAYKQLLAGSCSKYGAHVDDSVSYQVYNNIPEDDASILAVKETYGKVIEYKGDIISAYYFSTSCGYTSSANEVWLSAKPISYLEGKLQTVKKNQKTLDLTKEKAFREFLSDKTYKTYDSEFAWYRWKVSIDLENLKKVIDTNLKARYEANPNLILTLTDSNTYESVPISTIGTIKDIKIVKRQTGGLATQAIIKGSQATIKVVTEYNIRTLLAPTYDKVIRQDKSEVEKLSMLPSAFMYIDAIKKEGELTGFTFHGGGYGHGVGMSQNGVKAMADRGKKYEDILSYYYTGTNLDNLY